jgi:restriction system protein
MAVIPDNINANISPSDFEKLVKGYLDNLGKKLLSFKSIHDTKVDKPDGLYQIDVKAEFEFLNAKFLVIIECKKHINKIKRDVIQLLFDKLRSIGAQKGMIFSTSGFQEGAIKFAREHGIALIRVIEGKYTYITKSKDFPNYQPPPWADVPKYVGEFKYFENNSNNETTIYLQPGHLEPLRDFLFK